MKQSKASKAKASRKGSETCHEPVVDQPPFTVIIHDPELKRIIEERKAEEEKMALEEKVDEPILEQPILEEPVLEILIEEPVVCPEVEQPDMSTPDEYVARYTDDGQKVYNPASKRWVKCDSVLAKKLNLIR